MTITLTSMLWFMYCFGMHPSFIDRTGSIVGEWTVLKYLGNQSGSTWLCKCSCGTEKPLKAANLAKGNTRSCGCKKSQHITISKIRHGCTVGAIWTTEYSSWSSMKSRCKHSPRYKGVLVCEGLDIFDDFLRILGEAPNTGKRMSVDRIKTALHYSCGECEECHRRGWHKNVRWSTYKEQGRNKTDNRILEYNGEFACVTEWAERKGIKSGTLHYRIQAGWPIKRALETPVRKGNYR